MSIEPLRIGVVGCGAIGQAHIGVWSEISDARIAAVCDANPEQANAMARSLGCAPFTDLKAMAASGLIDAVDLCTPSGVHADQGMIAAEHGLHVLSEKPLDINAEKARALVALCEDRGLTLSCVLQRRTYSGARTVANAIHSGEFGELLSCCAYIKWWRDQAYYDSSRWRGSITLDGGVLANQGIHALDHLCWLAGPVIHVDHAYAATVGHRMEAEDFLIAVVRFASGARGVIEATTCCNPPLCSRIEVVGARGSAAFDDARVVQFGYGGEDLIRTVNEADAHLGGRAEAMAISMEGHRAILADFAAAVRDHRPPAVTGRDALVAVEALDLIYRAASASS